MVSTCLALLLASCNEPEQVRQAKMNISCFVFRDINRNGVFDLEDRPYAGLPVKLTDEDGEVRMGHSNIAGFANFAMAAGNPKHPIAEPGVYRIEAQTRSGWVITSQNADQDLEIRELTDSPGGLVAVKTLGQVGVAPALTLSGIVPQGAEFALRRAGDQESSGIPIESDGGFFSVPVSAGNWEIVGENAAAGETVSRVLVESYPVFLPDVGRPSLPTEEAGKVVIDFDGLTTSDTLYEVPSGYGGVNWHNWIATHQKFYSGYGYVNATTSGEYAAYNSSGHPAEFSSSKPFDVHRVNIGVAWKQAEEADIVVRAWRGDQRVYEDRFRSTTAGPITVQTNYRNVDRVEVSIENYWQVVMDDLHLGLK